MSEHMSFGLGGASTVMSAIITNDKCDCSEQYPFLCEWLIKQSNNSRKTPELIRKTSIEMIQCSAMFQKFTGKKLTRDNFICVLKVVGADESLVDNLNFRTLHMSR